MYAKWPTTVEARNGDKFRLNNGNASTHSQAYTGEDDLFMVSTFWRLKVRSLLAEAKQLRIQNSIWRAATPGYFVLLINLLIIKNHKWQSKAAKPNNLVKNNDSITDYTTQL